MTRINIHRRRQDSYKHPSLTGWIVNTPRGSNACLILLLPSFLLYSLWNKTSMLVGSGGKFQLSKTTTNLTSTNNEDGGGGDLEQNRWIHYSHCSRNNSSNTISNPLPRNWCLDDDRVPRYVGEHNGTEGLILRRYTHAGYERCLANKTVVFVGDSRVRYQFMHLASFLATKRQMRCQDFIAYNQSLSASSDPECYLIEHEYHGKMSPLDWNDWYNQSTNMLAKTDEQESLCDCFRPVPFRPATTYENRFIRRQTPYGILNLVYLQNFQNLVRIEQDYPPFAPFETRAPQRCAPGTCSHDRRVNAFAGTLNETLSTVLPLLNATHALVNLGWEFQFPFTRDEGRLSCDLRAFEGRHPGLAVDLITHVPKLGVLRTYEASRLDCPGAGVLNRWDIARGVPRSWYWDPVHVLGILNEAFNHELVEQLCPLDDEG